MRFATERRLVSSIYQARFNRYLLNHRMVDTSSSRVWTFLSDGEIEQFGDGSEFDFVEHIAARLPLAAISDMVGILTEEQAQVMAWTNIGAAIEDPDVGVEKAVTHVYCPDRVRHGTQAIERSHQPMIWYRH